MRVEEEPLTVKSLNSGDSFILDEGKKLVVWTGQSAHRLEKAKALDVVKALRDDRQGKAEVRFFSAESLMRGREAPNGWLKGRAWDMGLLQFCGINS